MALRSAWAGYPGADEATQTLTSEETTMARILKPFQCQECGKKLTLKQAEHAVYGDGCPSCGSADIDEAAGEVHPDSLAAECVRAWEDARSH